MIFQRDGGFDTGILPGDVIQETIPLHARLAAGLQNAALDLTGQWPTKGHAEAYASALKKLLDDRSRRRISLQEFRARYRALGREVIEASLS